MRRVLALAVPLALAGCATEATYVDPDPEYADDAVDQDPHAFDDVLADAGTWVTTTDWGDLFCPSPVVFGAGFVPYTAGRFVPGPRGWTFVGDLPLSWVVEHYGNWVALGLPTCQWGWAPGMLWGPAWVDFTVGGGVVAWTPSPPVHIGKPPRTHVGAPVVSSMRLPGPRSTIAGAPHALAPVAAVKLADFGSAHLATALLDGRARAAIAPSLRPLTAQTAFQAPPGEPHAAFFRSGFSMGGMSHPSFGPSAFYAGSYATAPSRGSSVVHAGHR